MPVVATWYERDLPVLEAVVSFFEEHGGTMIPQVFDIMDLTGMDRQTVLQACLALDGEYIKFSPVGGGAHDLHHIDSVTPAARRAVGQWPSAENWADRIIAALNTAAE